MLSDCSSCSGSAERESDDSPASWLLECARPTREVEEMEGRGDDQSGFLVLVERVKVEREWVR